MYFSRIILTLLLFITSQSVFSQNNSKSNLFFSIGYGTGNSTVIEFNTTNLWNEDFSEINGINILELSFGINMDKEKNDNYGIYYSGFFVQRIHPIFKYQNNSFRYNGFRYIIPFIAGYNKKINPTLSIYLNPGIYYAFGPSSQKIKNTTQHTEINNPFNNLGSIVSTGINFHNPGENIGLRIYLRTLYDLYGKKLQMASTSFNASMDLYLSEIL